MEDDYQSAEPCHYGMVKIQHPPANEIMQAVMEHQRFQPIQMSDYHRAQKAYAENLRGCE